MSPRPADFATRAIHHGYRAEENQGALVPPIHVSATFGFPDSASAAACFAGERPGYIYTRIANPTLDLLEQRIAALEQAEAAVAFASGMGAITATLWTLLSPGDEILVDTTLYGCTFSFLHHGLARFGVRVRHVDLTRPEALAEAFSPATRIVYFETPANPNMRIVDIAAVAEQAKARGALVVVDNTYCSPFLQRPLTLGADIVVHSATKYLGGHGDLTAGLVATSAELATRIRMEGLKDLTGAALSPHDAHGILRGLKTLHLRMERHCDNAQAIAEWLEAHPAVASVAFPGLASHPQHALAARQMDRFGGMLAFELHGGLLAGQRFMDALELITRAVSLGDAETLAQHPASMTHSTYSPEQRAAHGISEGLIRLSAGLEHIDDILADLARALDFAAVAPLSVAA
ncbi:methionine gamma-lyase [Pseudomarimonas salicorniae]|uniref:L-methionine gamma-lyase n=1 Tax=Pseudomarimonas salicorniae TaxID=2933270 RepID=A0ABT0GEA0_9GAMM|nr:methionine gamma-lyase [Lysobacter sp. CAU 1642]MCK7592878.1 methionine gamma-lyase [Lysobacter sp. CAU 1642]